MSKIGVPTIKGPHAYATFDGEHPSAPAWFAVSARKDHLDAFLYDRDKEAWRKGTMSPKKARKFAKALLALADQVDPPAPKYTYFKVHSPDGVYNRKAVYYRLRDGEMETFEAYDGKRVWSKSWAGDSLAALRAFWARWTVTEVTAGDLPKAAR